MTWTGAAGYFIVVLVFLCCLNPSLQACADYFDEDLWKNPLKDHYIPLQRLLPNQTLEDVVKNTLNNLCCKSKPASREIDPCDILSSCFQAVCDNSAKPLPWPLEMVSLHQFYCLIMDVTNLTSKIEMCQARGPAYNCMLKPTEMSSPSPFPRETTTVSRENATATPEANVTSYDSIRGVNTNLSTGIQSVLWVLLITSNAAWLVYFWQRRRQQQRRDRNGLRREEIPHSEVLMEEVYTQEGRT